MTKRFSKKTLGEYCDNIRGSLIDKNKFNMIDGTHQFLEFFRDKKVSEVIAALQMYGEGQLLTDEDWSNRIAAQEVIYELINKIVDYGRQESLWNIIEHFDLIGDR